MYNSNEKRAKLLICLEGLPEKLKNVDVKNMIDEIKKQLSEVA